MVFAVEKQLQSTAVFLLDLFNKKRCFFVSLFMFLIFTFAFVFYNLLNSFF